MHTLTTQVKVCELCQVWQALTQCNCSLISKVVFYTHKHIRVTSRIAHSPRKTSIRTLTTQGKLCELCQVWQALTKYTCSLISKEVICTHTHHTSHITHTHKHQSITSVHTLTTQAKVCKLWQVWQALTQYFCSLISNFIVCTHTTNQYDITYIK